MWQLDAAGDVSDYSTEVIAVLAALLADFLGIDLSALVLTVVPASVQLRATITTTSDASVLLATKIDSVTAEQATEVFSDVSVGGVPLTVTEVSKASVTTLDGGLSGGAVAGRLSAGAVAGIATGGLAVGVALVSAVALVVCRRRLASENLPPPPQYTPSGTDMMAMTSTTASGPASSSEIQVTIKKEGNGSPS